MNLQKALSKICTFFLFVTICVFVTGCSEKTAIINGVDEREANEIVVFLASKGISAEKQAAPVASSASAANTGILWNLYVDNSQITEAMSILNRNGLPRKQGKNLLELFSDSGLMPSDMQQKIKYQAGLAQQIANTIRQIDGVIDATVQLSFPTDDSTDSQITASVYVKHQGVLDNPNSQLITKIKQLVSASIAGLKLENVTVISDRSRFTDVTLRSENPAGSEEEKEFVTIWGVVIAKDSVGAFRLLFFSLCSIVLILVLALIWVIWKMLPLLTPHGGLSFFWKVKEKPTEEHSTEEKENTDSQEK
ncbi:MAG: type III secretion inner membrane ring lipoprotein SctJ [Chlamydiales bacterium]|nr:type III secretion inner membrane ring lipoprotein SctJ [Chlamydiales bacterium]